MMVVAFLSQAHLVLKAQNLLAVFAHLAIHYIEAGIDLIDPVFKGRQHQLMIIEISRLEKLNV